MSSCRIAVLILLAVLEFDDAFVRYPSDCQEPSCFIYDPLDTSTEGDICLLQTAVRGVRKNARALAASNKSSQIPETLHFMREDTYLPGVTPPAGSAAAISDPLEELHAGSTPKDVAVAWQRHRTPPKDEQMHPLPMWFEGATEVLNRADIHAAGKAAAAQHQAIAGSHDSAGSAKNKIILLVLEMVPLCGPLGIDRFYLGGWRLGIVKLAVCICTCFIGGVVWGTVDAVAVMVNALNRSRSIDTLGMTASFRPVEIEPAYTLGVVTLILQITFCCCGTCVTRTCLKRFTRRPAAAFSTTRHPAPGPTVHRAQGHSVPQRSPLIAS